KTLQIPVNPSAISISTESHVRFWSNEQLSRDSGRVFLTFPRGLVVNYPPMLDSPLLLGHRGAGVSSSVPENTIASFDHCLEQGCNGFEFDVRRTSCGCAIVTHDAKLKGLEVATTPAEQLTGVVHLEDVLKRYAGRAFLDIELKVSGLE